MTIFLVTFVISYMWHAMGVTIGYHRLLSHRSFKCLKWVEYFWVLGGYLAFEGSPIWWSAIHRAHHKHVDTPLDPHSPSASGIKYAWFGWMVEKGYASHVNPDLQCPDITSDPIYKFLEQGGDWKRSHTLTFVVGVVFRVLLLVFFGWQVAIASALAGVLVLQVPLMLNVFCHIPKLGYKNFECEDDSVNVWWVALLAMGEGWHNNHHYLPGSARSGIRPHEIDMSWLMLRLMKALGLVSWMNEATSRKGYEQNESRIAKEFANAA
jgi:sn-1 stearoyl-lipid 9-desaturase